MGQTLSTYPETELRRSFWPATLASIMAVTLCGGFLHTMQP